jgi:hypothetical protein
MVGYNVIIVVILIVALIIYAAVIYWTYVNRTWIFAPYTPPPLANGFQPGGQVISLTPAQQACRKQVLTGQTLPDPSCFETMN